VALGACSPQVTPDDPFRLPATTEEEVWAMRLGGALIGSEHVTRGVWPDGIEVVHQERRYAMRVGGTAVDTEVRTRALVDGEGALLRMEVDEADAPRTWRFDPPRPHLLEESHPALRRALRGEEVSLEVFHPTTGTRSPVRIRSAGGDWLEVEAPLSDARVLVDDAGRVRRVEAGALVVTREAEPPEPGGRVEVLEVLRRPTPPIEGARDAHTAVWTMVGVDLAALADFPPRQVVEGDQIRVRVPLPAEIPRTPGPVAPGLERWLIAEPGIPVGGPALEGEAAEIPGEEAAPISRVEALVRQVRRRLAPGVSVGFPDAAAALRAGRGDCSEHAAVFVSLARTAGIPARTVTGLVYLDDSVAPGLYPHAWAEVHLGEPVGWVPVDPALGQVVADATHLRFEGGLRVLDRIEVTSVQVW